MSPRYKLVRFIASLVGDGTIYVLYICLSLDFLRLTSNAVFLTWTCRVYISFRWKLYLDMHIHKICENWQKNTLSFYQFIKFCTTCRIINQKRKSFLLNAKNQDILTIETNFSLSFYRYFSYTIT